MVFQHLLEDRFLVVLVAVCAQVMRWTASLHRTFERIHRNSRPGLKNIIVCSLAMKTFYFAQLIFKLLIFLGQLSLRRNCVANVSLKRKNHSL